MQHALEVYKKDQLIFYSDKDWLHPLIDFKKFLEENPQERSQLLVKDKIIGRAAGLLLVYLQIRHVFTEMLSIHGKNVLDHFGIDYTYENLVPEIGCKTEQLLEEEWNPEKAYRFIVERIETAS